MILLDTNVLIYASDPNSPFCTWARKTIADAVAGDGAAINAAVLAELCVGDADPQTVADRVRGWGVAVLDVPAAAADACAEAYRQFRERRQAESGQPAPTMPLPDFFIGAHALIMGWELATADQGRFKVCFPTVTLKMPK
ncbi:MAG: PIN domain-containing protein [Candidatus Hydrogenedentes bacterium]|nr:PIN domain-containing protein [Candidatus Hydrogenedentota bacterium]